MLQMQVGGRRGGVHEYRSASSPSGTCIKPTEIEFSPGADRAGVRKQGLVCTVRAAQALPTARVIRGNTRVLHCRGAAPANRLRVSDIAGGSAKKYMTGLNGPCNCAIVVLAKVIGQSGRSSDSWSGNRYCHSS